MHVSTLPTISLSFTTSMNPLQRRRENESPSPLLQSAPPQNQPIRASHSSNDGTHRHTDRLIDKFMQRKIESAPPDTHHLVRQQSVFNFVERKEKTKPKQTTFKKFQKKIRKFNTIIAFVFLVLYIGGGAALFWRIESTADKNLNEYQKDLHRKSKELYKKIGTCDQQKLNNTGRTHPCVKEIFNVLVEVNPPKYIDSYWNGLAYVLTCITTIGYGQFVCYTIAGKMVTVVYGIIGIALTIYVLRHNGKIALKVCNWVLGLVARCIRSCGSNHVKFQMTVTKSFILLFVFWVLGALGIASYEEFVFWDAIYFAFSTFSTVGFGDLVPSTDVSGVVIFVLHFLDLSLLSMVFVLVQQTMENNFMKVLELLDEGYRKHTTEMNTGTLNLQSPGASRRGLDVAVSTAREKN